jgi:hypothetical protein
VGEAVALAGRAPEGARAKAGKQAKPDAADDAVLVHRDELVIWEA